MNHYRVIFFILLAVTALILCGCTQPTDPDNDSPHYGWPGPGVQTASSNSPIMANVDFGYVDLTDPQTREQMAKADLLVLETSMYWSPLYNEGTFAEVRALHPNIKIVAYNCAHGTWARWGDVDPELQPFGYDWYTALRPYWTYTTTGDTMMTWTGRIAVNILDPNCRAAMIGVLLEHAPRWSNRFDGVFWDHFNEFLWIPDYIPNLEGEMDLDEDGIPHREDEDEMAAYRLASENLIQEVRAAFGDDFIQIVNGGRALVDSVFASMVDGMFYEHFPEAGFWGADVLADCLDPTVPNNLLAAKHWPRTRNGGPWLILSNERIFRFMDPYSQFIDYRFAEWNRVIALLAGVTVCYHSDDELMHWGWPEVELQLGQSLGGMTRVDNTYSRAFEHGSVTMTLTPQRGVAPDAITFEIIQDGEVVQSYDFPEHFP